MTDQRFVDLLSVGKAEALAILERAREIKKDPTRFAGACRNKLLFALFEKTSTRTNLSFARAMTLLGGVYLPQRWADSNFAISDIELEARYVATTADCILVRLKHYQDVCKVARGSSVPVINGLCDRFHPMQALGDALTLLERFGDLEGRRLVYLGVANNVLNSLAALLVTLGVRVTAVVPERNATAADDRVQRLLAASGLYLEPSAPTPDQAAAEIERADAVYLDTWVDLEHFGDAAQRQAHEARAAAMRPFSLTRELYGASRAVIMHCMPIHPGMEMSREMVDHRNAVIFPQALNRTYAQASVLVSACGVG